MNTDWLNTQMIYFKDQVDGDDPTEEGGENKPPDPPGTGGGS